MDIGKVPFVYVASTDTGRGCPVKAAESGTLSPRSPRQRGGFSFELFQFSSGTGAGADLNATILPDRTGFQISGRQLFAMERDFDAGNQRRITPCALDMRAANQFYTRCVNNNVTRAARCQGPWGTLEAAQPAMRAPSIAKGCLGMIVCHCNRIDHAQIEVAADTLTADQPWSVVTPLCVYRAIGKRPRCGGCLPLAVSIIYARDSLRRSGGCENCPKACVSFAQDVANDDERVDSRARV